MVLRFHKKGMANETLVLLIVALALVVGYLFFNKGVGEASDKAAVVTACRSSVERNAKLHINGFEFPTTINCPARNIKVTKSDNSAKKVIADSMADCWYQYGEGKLNLFKDEATYCAVCSFVEVDTKDPITGLGSYLMTEQISDNSGRLYTDYLGGFKTPRAEQVLGVLKNERLLDTAVESKLAKGTYAVIFVYAKGKDEIAELANHLTAQTTAGKAGLIIGAGFGTLAAGGTMMAIASIGVVAGPPGWVVLAAGAAAFSVFYGASQAVTFLLSPDNVPEWAAFTALREWGAAKTADILKNEFGCTYFPAELE